MRNAILTLNAGSSSIRLALYDNDRSLQRHLFGKVDRIGLSGTSLVVSRASKTEPDSYACAIDTTDYDAAINWLMDWLATQPEFSAIKAIGHRVVHGMTHNAPERVTPALLAELRRIMPFDPEHLPHEIALIEACQRRYPDLSQVACFDTTFHRSMPRVAKLLPIPHRYQSAGVERYGFHGLSYEYLLGELVRLADPAATRGKVILAHLGGGASLAAVCSGQSVDTSMGFTPTAGLVMGTRTGDLDPGLMYYLAQTEQMSVAQFQRLVNHESGLLGVSGRSSDLRDLLANESDNPRAADAVALFCYQVRKWIGSFAAVLGGLDTLVFSGGIGENAPVIRDRICAGLGFLGIDISATRNSANAAVISADTGRVTVRVMRTDEELVIAKSVSHLLEVDATRRL